MKNEGRYSTEDLQPMAGSLLEFVLDEKRSGIDFVNELYTRYAVSYDSDTKNNRVPGSTFRTELRELSVENLKQLELRLKTGLIEAAQSRKNPVQSSTKETLLSSHYATLLPEVHDARLQVAFPEVNENIQKLMSSVWTVYTVELLRHEYRIEAFRSFAIKHGKEIISFMMSALGISFGSNDTKPSPKPNSGSKRAPTPQPA